MTNHFRSVLLGLLLLAFAAVGQAQPEPVPATLYRHDFENGELAGWSTLGPAARLSLTQDKQQVKAGAASLRFDYEVAKNQMNAMIVSAGGPVPEMALVKSFRFWIKTDYAAPILLLLQEQGGGRYCYTFSTPRDVWQYIEVAPADFILSDDKDDPEDPDNKLDIDRVEAIGIADMSQIFAQDDDVVKVLEVRTGAHTLYVDDLVVSSQPPSNTVALPEAAETTAGMLDAFPYPQPSWLGTGAVALSVVVDEGLQGRALKASYRHTPDKFVAMVRRLPRGALAGTDGIAFDASSFKPITLVVQAEERGGGKYNATIAIPGDLRPFAAKQLWKNFVPADDSRDVNNQLDLDQVNQLLILDATGFLEVATGPNTFWLARLRSGPILAPKQLNVVPKQSGTAGTG
jgi:hypothetical protein